MRHALPNSRLPIVGGFLPVLLEIRTTRTDGRSAAPEMMLLRKTLPVRFPTLKARP